VKDTRLALRRGPARRTPEDLDLIGQPARTNQELYRALLWCDQLISHRARGFRKVDNLIGLIHLICGPIEIELPT
jgi:hypothetical protein